MPRFNQELYDHLIDHMVPGHEKYTHGADGKQLPPPTEEVLAEAKRYFEWCCAFDGVAPSKIPPYHEYQKPKKPHRFITISLPKGMDPPQVDSSWRTFLSKKTYAQQITGYTLEFTNQELGYHPHIHALLVGTKSPQKHRLIRDITSHFKIESNYVDIKTHTDPELYSTRLEYIKGKKTEMKKQQLEIDERIRAENGLKSFYI